MDDGDQWRPETLAAQALGWIDESTKAVVPSIHLATTYLRDPDNRYRSGRAYGRADNPSFDQPEALLARLEGGAAALAFASGMAAATTVFLALAPGDHVVAPKVMYWALRRWLTGTARGWGLAVDIVDMTDLAALTQAMRPGRTRLVWIETPANPTWAVTDIAAAAAIAHDAGALLAVDSTVATPMLTRPIALGADLVMHSATKYLNGHSDVIAGALVTARADAFWQRIVDLRSSNGAILGPVEAWLLLRGMRTLPLRVQQACRSAAAIAAHFQRDPRIRSVLYPGLADAPGHAVAARQMQGGFGGMLSLCIAAGEMAAIAAAARVRLWKRATSLGGVESLIEHPGIMTHASLPEATRRTLGISDGLIRLSVGVEDVQDLIGELEQALAP